MNQILQTNNIGNNKNSDSSDTKKILMFFGIALLIFGIVIIAIYTYKMYASDDDTLTYEGPQLSFEQSEGDSKIVIVAKSEVGISKIIYSLNDDEQIELDKNGVTSIEEAIETQKSENTLYVKVIDTIGKEIEATQTFYIEENTNLPNIYIDEEVLETTGKVQITATDENNYIKYLAYSWNDDEETIIETDTEDQTTIEVTIDVQRGQNTLYIRAVNGLDNEQTMEKILKGINQPVIDVSKDGDTLYMTISHDLGFKSIEFTVNGKEYVYDENYSGYDATKTEISYKFKLQEGENTVIIHAVSTEDSEKTYRGKCTYTAEE